MELNDTELRKVQRVMMIFMSLWMLFLTFALLGILFGLYMSVILSFQNIGVGLFLLGFVMFLSILPCYLAFSKNAKKYFNGEAVVNN